MAMPLETRTDRSTGKLFFHPMGWKWPKTSWKFLQQPQGPHTPGSISFHPCEKLSSFPGDLGTAWCQYINKQRSALWQGHSPALCQKCCQTAITACNWALRSICLEVSQGEILQMKIIDVYVTHTHTYRVSYNHSFDKSTFSSACNSFVLHSWTGVSLAAFMPQQAGLLLALHWAMPGAGHRNPCNNIFIPQIFINFSRLPDRIHYLQAFTRTSGETGPGTLLTSINSAPLKSTQLCQLALDKN